jgi:hypothetical protein
MKAMEKCKQRKGNENYRRMRNEMKKKDKAKTTRSYNFKDWDFII